MPRGADGDPSWDLVKRGIKKKVFVILDDCMFDKKILTSKAARDIHMNGRHCGILFINLVQYAIDIPKPLRGQIDYVFATMAAQTARARTSTKASSERSTRSPTSRRR